MPDINISTEGLDWAFKLAEGAGAKDEFASGLCQLLDTMTSIGLNTRDFTMGEVWKDWAPGSLNWALFKRVPRQKDQVFYHGGLIYHGPYDHGGGDAPALSVVIDRDVVTQPHLWQIHT